MLSVQCPACQARMRVKPQLAGRTIKCPKCQHELSVPAESAASPSASETLAAPQPPAPTPAPAEGPTEAAGAPVMDGFQINAAAPPSTSYRRKSGNGAGLALGVTLLAAAAGGALWYFRTPERAPEISVQELPDQTIPEGQPFTLRLPLAAGGGAPTFELISGPPGATVDSATTSFVWTPAEADGPGEYAVAIRVTQGTGQSEGRFRVKVTEVNQPPRFEPVSAVEAAPEAEVRLQFAARDPDLPATAVRYSIASEGEAFSAAKIEPQSGAFTWTPSELLAGEAVTLRIQAAEEPDGVVTALLEVPITVSKFGDPVRQLTAELRQAGLEVQKHDDDPKTVLVPFRGKPSSLTVEGAPLTIFHYDSSSDLDAELSQVDAGNSMVLGERWTADESLTLLQRDGLVVATTTSNADVLARLSELLDPPIAVVRKYEPPPIVVKETSRLVAALKPLYEEQLKRPGRPRKLFTNEAYLPVRKIFAEEFAAAHDIDLRAGFVGDYDEAMKWFETRNDLQEELYTAIDSERDDVIGAVTMFNHLRREFPKQIDKYGPLAIATSVVWDNDRNIYSYSGHAKRTHSTMPDTLLSGLDNFRYLVEAESVMEGRAQYAPWEFLVHLVNHNTPSAERVWAVQNYLPSRPMFGKCYADVPYDTVMLETGSKVCRLADKAYILPNLRQFGGVCAMQADYAARVGKSMGVPAAYVSGEGRYGGAHAWVMWVELQAINPRAVRFTLESHGRYHGDHYYVGNLKDPQTGRGMTDRLLELRLHQVGVDAMAKRHCDRIMQLYPAMAEELEFDLAARLDYLSGAIKLNPWSEAAWTALAQLAAGGELDKDQRKTMEKVLEQLFVNFAHFPDFTLTVFDDLIAYEADAGKRIALYYRLLDVYAAAERPDLAFSALLRLSELLEEEQRTDEAVQALAAAVQKYAVEGQYIPKMLDRLETLAGSKPGTEQTLAAFYAGFLPKIPQKRGSEPSKYCIAMYERSVPIFEKAGQPAAAQTYATAARSLKNGN